MPVTFMQKLQLWFRGSQRRREERDREFLDRNAGWGAASAKPAAAARPAAAAARSIDRDGLQAAYLDRSGLIRYYLDLETGEVVDVRDGGSLAAPRYHLVPTQSEEEDRRAFLGTLDASAQARLGAAASFREGLAADRTLERAYYNFKTQRAIDAIEEWLARLKM
jgi:hypothetical protein